ncbi:MAG: pyridoxal phosphate-dependent decarboxylase family protein [Actinomycetes bacterium]
MDPTQDLSKDLSRDLPYWLGGAVGGHQAWLGSFGPYHPHPSLDVDPVRFGAALAELAERMRDNYPFGHPRYAGQMVKPPHPAALVGYLAAMQVNPNNHALDGGPATAAMEKEVVAALAAMFGLPDHLGHLTSSGTIANLEALFVARETHPDRGVAYSADAHYTHARMCHLLGVRGHAVATDAAGRMDMDALADLLATGAVGTVVATAGTTGLGAVDRVDLALELCRRHGVRLHVDAAYGGFFTLLADDSADGVPAAPWLAIAGADSVVVDPHKHGLQPYGCGAVLFRDPSVGRFYSHDSPYTYFTSDELHLGEISLECSRAGASAAALWLTMRLFPPTADGLGAVLRPGRRAALRWAGLLEASDVLDLYQRPELDIVAFFPRVPVRAGAAGPSLAEIDAASGAVMRQGMDERSVFLATYAVDAPAMAARGHRVVDDLGEAGRGRILRSVLMKPESEPALDGLHDEVTRLAGQALEGLDEDQGGRG